MQIKAYMFAVFLIVATAVEGQSSGDIAYFHVNRAKLGMTAQYETARKRHWVWHQKMGDTWSFYVWQIVSGEASGTYMVCSFGHDWKEVDESDQKVGGEEDDPAASVEPYLDAEWESYYRYLPKLSLAPKDGFSPSAKLAVTRFLLKPEQVGTFVAAETKISEALKTSNHPETIRWYQVVSGGETPQFLMLVDRANWAAHTSGPPKKGLCESWKGSTARTRRQAFCGRLAALCVHSTSKYRADLSFVPTGKQ